MRLIKTLSQLTMFALSFILSLGVKPSKVVADTGSLFEIQATNIDQQPTDLSIYAGKVALVVNTASKCGFTPQLQGLEALYQKYQAQGFVVLGFPSNDFLSQEPGTDGDIKNFCSTTYQVSFPLFTKNPVTGSAKQPVYKFLTDQSGYSEVRWNFEKFLIGKEGKVIARWRSAIKPESPEIVEAIEIALR